MARERETSKPPPELHLNEADLASDRIQRQLTVSRDAAAYAAMCVELGYSSTIGQFPGNERQVLPRVPMAESMLDTIHRKLIKVQRDRAKPSSTPPNPVVEVELSGLELDEVNIHMLAVQKALLRVSFSKKANDQATNPISAGGKAITYKEAQLHFFDINIAYTEAGGRPRQAILEQFDGSKIPGAE